MVTRSDNTPAIYNLSSHPLGRASNGSLLLGSAARANSVSSSSSAGSAGFSSFFFSVLSAFFFSFFAMPLSLPPPPPPPDLEAAATVYFLSYRYHPQKSFYSQTTYWFIHPFTVLQAIQEMPDSAPMKGHFYCKWERTEIKCQQNMQKII